MTRSRDLANLGDNSSALENQGLTLIKTESFSAVASHSVNDVFSATYDFYKIIIVAENSSANWQFKLRLRVSGSDNSASNYLWSAIQQRFNSATPSLINSGSNGLTTSFEIGATSNPTATLGNQTIVEIGNPFATSETTFNSSSVGYEMDPTIPTSFRQLSGGLTSVTTSYTGFTIFATNGNITGSVSVYGYKK
jgi:hypothetical protein